MIDSHDVIVETPGGIDLGPISSAGTLTIDLGWSPHVQATLTLAPNENALALAASDRLIVHLLQRTGTISFLSDLDYLIAGGDTTDFDTLLATGTTTAVVDDLITAGNYNSPPLAATSRRFDLIVTDAPRLTPDGVVLSLGSDEHEFDSILWFWPTPLTITERTPAGMLAQAFAALEAEHVDWTAPTVFDIGLQLEYPEEPIVIERAGAVFDEIIRRIAYLRHRVYSPGDGTLLIRRYPWTTSDELEVEVTQGYNLIDWDIPVGSDERYLVSFISPADPAERELYMEVTPGSEEFLPPPRTLVSLDLLPIVDPPLGDLVLPVVQNPAEPFITRQRTQSSPRTLRAISNYTARAGETVVIDIPEFDFFTPQLIHTVQFQLGSNQMTITF